MNVGKFLKKIRLDNELTQQAMADKLGVSQSYYSAVESNRKQISDALLQKAKDLFVTDDSIYSTVNFDLPDKILLNETENNAVSKLLLERLKNKQKPSQSKEWNILYNEAVALMGETDDYYKRIVDVKILLKDYFNYEIVSNTYAAFENNTMDSFFKDGHRGMLRLHYSTAPELSEYIVDLKKLVQWMHKRFFYLFRVLYSTIRKKDMYVEDIFYPENID